MGEQPKARSGAMVFALSVWSAAVLLPLIGGQPSERVARFEGPGGGGDVATAVVASPDGELVFVTGSAYDGPESGDDYLTVAYTPSGRQVWVSAYDGPDTNIDNAQAAAVDRRGRRVFVTGSSFGGPATVTDIATVAYDAATGEELWVARYDGPANDTDAGTSVVTSPDGAHVYVTGASVGDDGALDVVTVAYDPSSGDEVWVARHADPAGGYEEGFAVDVSRDGARVFVTGYQTSETIDFLTLAYDATTGTELWASVLDSGGEEVSRSLAVAPDGASVFVTGARTEAPSSGRPPQGGSCVASGPRRIGADYVTVAYDAATGQASWKRAYDGPARDCDEAFSVAVGPDGDAVYVTGSSFGAGTDGDYATVAYGAVGGDELWSARHDGPDSLYDRADGVVVAPDGASVVVTGVSTGGATDFDYATIAYESTTGDELWTAWYNGPGSEFDAPNGIAVGPFGDRVYVTGTSAGIGGIEDYATVFYRR